MFRYIEEFSERPFNPEMNMWGWVLFIGFLLIVSGLWASVLNLLRD